MLQVFVGHSEDVLAAEAAREAVGQLRCALAGAEPQAGILFCSVDYDHVQILDIIRTAFPVLQLVGCTTDGELSSALGFTEDSLTLMVFVSDDIEIRAGVGREAGRRGEEAGREAAASALAGLRLRAGEERFAIILADPVNAGISNVDKGVRSVLGYGFPVIGGAAAAHSKQRKTFQFCNGEVGSDSVALLLFAGPVVFSWALLGGLSPMGPKEPVTRGDRNVLYEIGGQPAVEYYRKYIGRYDLFMNYCLAVYEKGREGFYVRSAPFADPVKGAVTLNGLVPEGAMVQIGTADKEGVVASCDESVRKAAAAYPGGRPSGALFFSCAGRKMVMGTQIVQEVEAVKRQLPDIPFIGFYGYGEFAPLDKGAPYMFHGATFVSLLIGPAEDA